MFYNNETDNKAIWYADSPDLENWTDRGKLITDQAGEGPKAFRWRGKWWLITDVWNGLAVYRSDDGLDVDTPAWQSARRHRAKAWTIR